MCNENETPNFMVITSPEDFALFSALYRSSVDGRHYMYEAILSEDGMYNIPDKFTSRAVQILQVYLKSLGVKMETIVDEDNFILTEEDNSETIIYTVGDISMVCTVRQMYYLKRLRKVFKRYLKEYSGGMFDMEEAWDYILEHLPFKRKYLTDDIIKLFKDHLVAFASMKE